MTTPVMTHWLLCAVSGSLFTTLVIGCGGSEFKEVKVVPVSGVINYEGKPLPQANVVFIPKEGPRATAVTDAQGKFVLTTTKENDGAVPGEHVVLIEKTLSLRGSDIYAPRKSVIPEKYNSPRETDIKETVSSTGKNEFQIDLQ